MFDQTLSDIFLRSGSEQIKIPYNDNTIIQHIVQSEGKIFYSFLSSYEITINDCMIKDVTTRAGRNILNIDISETEEQKILSDFVTDIAYKVGLKKNIYINNIALDLDLDKIYCDDDSIIEIIHKQPQLLSGCQIDIVIEWPSFTVEVIKGIDVNLVLALTLLKISSLTEQPRTDLSNAPNVLKIIRDTSAKSIDPSLTPKLYERINNIEIRYQITN